GVLGDLAPKAKALRERGEVLEGKLHDLLGVPKLSAEMDYHRGRRHFSVLSFRACDEAFRDNELFSSAAYRESPGVRSLGRTILEMTGDEHRRYRAVAQPMFIKPKVMNWWKPKWIQEGVDGLLDRLESRDAADLNLELCARLPMHVVTRGIGMNGDDALTFRDHLLRGASYQLPMEERIQSQGVVARMLKELVAKRREQPEDDVVSALIGNDFKLEDGSARKLTDDEVFSYCRLIMFAGGGTTWRQLGITLYALLTEYANWEQCRDDRTLLEPAVNESVRWCPTVSTFQRLVTRDTELAGVPIPADSIVDISLSSANRDPERWDEPDRYDIRRPDLPHIGFSIGQHQCLGMNVAKQELIVALDGLMSRFPSLRLDPAAPTPELVGGLEQRGVTAVPVLLR
ncbi:MAG TPA: cytochrome P450, partial [Nevskiaceae bacterium]|nr:cytochrome P450 [Nevskiaceae bacterium]